MSDRPDFGSHAARRPRCPRCHLPCDVDKVAAGGVQLTCGHVVTLGELAAD